MTKLTSIPGLEVDGMELKILRVSEVKRWLVYMDYNCDGIPIMKIP